jgi:hypothetical protein
MTNHASHVCFGAQSGPRRGSEAANITALQAQITALS